MAGDACFGAYSFAYFEGVAKHGVEHGAHGIFGGRGFPGSAYLAEDFVFAEYGGVQPGRYRKEVPYGVGVVEAGQVFGKLFGRGVHDFGEKVVNVLVSAVEFFGEGVDLDAVAGGEHYGFGDVLA